MAKRASVKRTGRPHSSTAVNVHGAMKTRRRPRRARRPAAGVSLADRAYEAVLDEILRGRLTPGTPVSRRRVAHELGMSVLPVTEALQRLQEEGLLETRARAGTRVRVPSDSDVQQLYELREALETQAARLFAERSTLGERRAIERSARPPASERRCAAWPPRWTSSSSAWRPKAAARPATRRSASRSTAGTWSCT